MAISRKELGNLALLKGKFRQKTNTFLTQCKNLAPILEKNIKYVIIKLLKI